MLFLGLSLLTDFSLGHEQFFLPYCLFSYSDWMLDILNFTWLNTGFCCIFLKNIRLTLTELCYFLNSLIILKFVFKFFCFLFCFLLFYCLCFKDKSRVAFPPWLVYVYLSNKKFFNMYVMFDFFYFYIHS